jgi:hypothetical protein
MVAVSESVMMPKLLIEGVFLHLVRVMGPEQSIYVDVEGHILVCLVNSLDIAMNLLLPVSHLVRILDLLKPPALEVRVECLTSMMWFDEHGIMRGIGSKDT